MFAINGKFLARDMNGQIRVAMETIKELDKIIPPNFAEIVAPESEYHIDGLKNIPVKRIGKGNRHIWEQTYYFLYLLTHRAKGINIFNSHPIFKPDIAYIHDLLPYALPNLYTTRYGKAQFKFNRRMIASAVKRAKQIIVVSEFTRNELMKYFNVDPAKIHVIYNGCQHMNSITEDEEIFNEFPEIHKGEYILAASGITPQKNFQWIIENAKYNPEITYVIVGSKEKSTNIEVDKIPQRQNTSETITALIIYFSQDEFQTDNSRH